ncbi:MAG: 50S ribosomal protein L19e [Candidatus Aenigmatarchaeota archaeon]
MTSLQKRLAARILKVGQSRVWLDPSKIKEIEKAITYADVRRAILKGWIKKLPEKIKVKTSKKSKRGEGSRKGKKHSIIPAKRKWIQTVRALREYLKKLKATKQIDNTTFKRLYRLVKGGAFRSKSHLKIYMEQHGLLKKE